MTGLQVRIFKELRTAGGPLLAREIAMRLSTAGSRRIDTTDVNRAIYEDEFRSLLQQDADFKWTLPEPYRSLHNRILRVLESAGTPLLAREIAGTIEREFGKQVRVSLVNGMLSGELKGAVWQDSAHRWKIYGGCSWPGGYR